MCQYVLILGKFQLSIYMLYFQMSTHKTVKFPELGHVLLTTAAHSVFNTSPWE